MNRQLRNGCVKEISMSENIYFQTRPHRPSKCVYSIAVACEELLETIYSRCRYRKKLVKGNVVIREHLEWNVTSPLLSSTMLNKYPVSHQVIEHHPPNDPLCAQ
jgi:hypothetical protein